MQHNGQRKAGNTNGELNYSFDGNIMHIKYRANTQYGIREYDIGSLWLPYCSSNTELVRLIALRVIKDFKEYVRTIGLMR